MHDAPEPAPRKPRRLWLKVCAALLSTVAGLAIAELGFGLVRGWAFPALNIYEADADYGVRLAPHAETVLRTLDGRTTDIRTNGLGFRGPDWTTPAGAGPIAGRVLLLGDSQVFGYGVDEDDALAPQLAAALGPEAEVLPAAVPTWGPPELARAAAELVPALRPERVVFVVNVANDWVEADVPNRRRVTARDGWAVAWEPDAEPPSAFPGRAWLMGRSQLVFAVRRLFADSAESVDDGGVDWLLQRMGAHDPARSGGPALARAVLAAREACRAHGCAFSVAVLPLDVEVDRRAWAKYGTPQRPLGILRVQVERLAGDLGRQGVVGVDLHGPLAAACADAEPSCFQPHDYHLSPRGHGVVAAALADHLTAADLSDRAPAAALPMESP
jgi:hypothetical protein